MTYINPISGTAMAGAVQQDQLAADKTRQLRQQEKSRRNVTASVDHFEHAVENAEEVAAVHDEQKQRRQQDGRRRSGKKKPPAADDDSSHIDLVG